MMALLAATLWARQQDQGRRVAEARADVAEAQLASAAASLTAIVGAQATASATALAQASLPGPALERALNLVFAVYQDPTDEKLRGLGEAFGPAARAVFQREADHLRQDKLRLGGDSRFELTIVSTTPRSTAEQADIKTREIWIYDERNLAGVRTRCIREESEQTYAMRRTAGGWLAEEVQLGTSKRVDC